MIKLDYLYASFKAFRLLLCVHSPWGKLDKVNQYFSTRDPTVPEILDFEWHCRNAVQYSNRNVQICPVFRPKTGITAIKCPAFGNFSSGDPSVNCIRGCLRLIITCQGFLKTKTLRTCKYDSTKF